MGKKELNYQSIDALKVVARVIDEAAEAIKDQNRVVVNSALPEILGAVGGGAVGGVIAGGLIYSLGTVGLSASGLTSGLGAIGLGAGMAVGIGVAAVIVAAPAVGGYALISYAKKRKLIQEKERLYKEALLKNSAIIDELKNRQELSLGRIEYLHSLNVLLQRVINDLKADLEVE